MIKKFLILFMCLNIGIANAAEFTTKAESAYLVDYDSGDVIVSKNADELMPPSSMLKLMTLTVLFDEVKTGKLKTDDVLTVSENADYKNLAGTFLIPSRMRHKCFLPGSKKTHNTNARFCAGISRYPQWIRYD